MKLKLVFLMVFFVYSISHFAFAGRIISERHFIFPFLSLHKQEKLPGNEIIIIEAYLENVRTTYYGISQRFDNLFLKVKVKNYHWEKVFTVGSDFYSQSFLMSNYITEDIYFEYLFNCISYEGKNSAGEDIFEVLVKFPVEKYSTGTRSFWLELVMDGQKYRNNFDVGHDHF